MEKGWERCYDYQTGKIFYVDHNTQTTHWEYPNEINQNHNDLTKGLIGFYEEPLNQIHTQLTELIKTQHETIRQLEIENEDFNNLPELKEAVQIFNKIPEYEQKIQTMKRQMNAVTNKLDKLNTRTKKLQTKKQADDQQEVKRKQLEAEKEQALLAKPSQSLLESQKQTK
eukprot:TRINITY_DN97677_c1_g1_i1.p1 TRINITY_DN97677_c1_g1~~TRINITY_DN97677_c1_g1_i1.p1  ORF type:complete len:170 (-),score=26.52 TRINITY_DN97677_c1_g1_i1:175-684(-)